MTTLIAAILVTGFALSAQAAKNASTANLPGLRKTSRK